MNRRYLLLLIHCAAIVLSLSWSGTAPANEMDEDRPLTGIASSVQPDLFTGALTTSIPIEVPPGRSGIQPSLNLAYWSGSGNGWVGQGWKLELGAVERQTRFGLNYSGDDYSFRLNGAASDLVAIGSGEYRAKIEGGFTRLRKLTAADGKPYWEATDKKGTRYLFGQTAASRMADPGDAGKIFKWCLDRVEDTNGNFMTVTYTSDQNQGYLSQIDYAGNGSTQPTNQIKFYLEDRSDAAPMYTTNYQVLTAKRLKTIEVLANGNRMRAYKLSYVGDSNGEPSKLRYVTQYGKDAGLDSTGSVVSRTYLPAISFDYTAYGTNSFQSSYVSTYYGGDGWGMSVPAFFPDLNGDGKADICRVKESGSSWDVYCALGSGDGRFQDNYVSTYYGGDGWSTSYPAFFPDLNGDGKADHCRVKAAGSGWDVYCALGQGNGSFQSNYASTYYGGDGWSSSYPSYFVDVDGDGKADICRVKAAGSGWDVYCAPTIRTEPATYLNALSNGLGGTTTVTYIASTQQTNTQLPFPLQRVSAITTSDGNGNSATTSYTYSGGFYHFGERDFRGVNYAKVTGPVGPNGERAITETWFHQGNDTAVDVNSPNVANGYMKGKPYRTKVTDGSGNLYAETTISYTADADGVAPFYTPQQEVNTTICDGTSCGKQTRTVSTYDSYGNITRADQYGDLNDTSDDLTVVRTFTLNTTDWIVGLPASETVYQGIGTSPQIAQSTFYYDGTTSCSTASTNQTPTQGNLTRIVRWLSGGTNPDARMAYDSYGNRTCARDANGNVSTVTYDASFTFLKVVTNALGHQATTQYYGVDGVSATTGLYGQVKSVTDPNGAVTSIEYDVLGRKTKVTNADGFWTTTAYNSLGTVGSQHVRTDSSLSLSSWTYFDGLGRPIKKKSTGPDSKVTVTDTQYNVRGAVLKTSLPYFEGTGSPQWKSFIYDPVGRTTRTDNPDASRILACYDDWMSVTIDANNHKKREVKDTAGRLIRVDEYTDTFTTCDAAVGTPYATTTYQYDTLGNLRFVTDAKGNRTEMQYDSLSRKTSMHDPDMGDWTYLYDAGGNLTKQTDAKSQVLWFQYDALNRRRQKDYGTQKSLGSGDVVYTYDGTNYNRKGRLASVQDSAGSVSFQYDVAGRAIRTDKTLGSTTYTIQSTYDGLGRTTSLTYPDNSTVTNSYNGPLLQQVAEGATVYAQYAGYNAFGQPNTLTLGNGVVTTYTYLATNGRMSTLSTVKGTTSLQGLEYTYDAMGNVTALIDTVNCDQAFTYDELDRLLTATGPYGSLTYAYDQIGNMTSNSQVGSYTYPTSGSTSVRPHAVSTAGSNSYTYDANGNLTVGAGRTISYDSEDLPTSITQSGMTTTFVYDGGGNRVKKLVGTTTTTYLGSLYDCEDTGSGPQCVKYIFADSQRIAMKQVSSGTVDYYHSDHLGSTSVMTTSAGLQEEGLTYYPYGAVRSDTGTTNVPYKYTGQELDASTGLYFYGARYYDANLARFISADTIAPDLRDPQSLNRYAYVRNNPLHYSDPTGHDLWDDIGDAFSDAVNAVSDAVGEVAKGLDDLGPLGAVLEVGLQAVDPVMGTWVMTQSEQGRYILSAEIIAASAVATFECAGCGATLTIGGLTINAVPAGALVGSTTMSALGGYSAAENGGDISQGIFVGSVVGAATGAIGGYVNSAAAFEGAKLGSDAFLAKAGLYAMANIASGTLNNAASGAVTGYAGGAGGWDAIVRGVGRNAASGFATEAGLTALGLAWQQQGVPFFTENTLVPNGSPYVGTNTYTLSFPGTQGPSHPLIKAGQAFAASTASPELLVDKSQMRAVRR